MTENGLHTIYAYVAIVKYFYVYMEQFIPSQIIVVVTKNG